MDYPKMIYLHGSKKGTRVNSIEEEETLLGVRSESIPEPVEPQPENEEPPEEEIELPKEEHHHKTKIVKKVKKGKK